MLKMSPDNIAKANLQTIIKKKTTDESNPLTTKSNLVVGLDKQLEIPEQLEVSLKIA